MSDSADIFDTVSRTADSLALALPGPAAIVAKVIAVATKAAGALSRQGLQPEIEIAKILSQEPSLERVRDEFEQFIRDNWPREDVYDDTE